MGGQRSKREIHPKGLVCPRQSHGDARWSRKGQGNVVSGEHVRGGVTQGQVPGLRTTGKAVQGRERGRREPWG